MTEYIELLGESCFQLGEAVDRYSWVLENIKPDGFDSLEFEYNRLFVGPSRLVAPPYGSVYHNKEHLVMGDSTLEVRRKYHESGFFMRKLFREPEDHIATELEYLVELQKKTIETLENEKDIDKNIRSVIVSEKTFINSHILCWIPEFCERINEGSNVEFFKALADVLEAFIRKDNEVLEDLEALVCNEEKLLVLDIS